MSLAITPSSATNQLLISVFLNVACSDTSLSVIAALFQDSTANALAAHAQYICTANVIYQIQFTCLVEAGTTSATEFAVRVGPNSTGTVTINGKSAARYCGGALISSMTIMEIQG